MGIISTIVKVGIAFVGVNVAMHYIDVWQNSRLIDELKVKEDAVRARTNRVGSVRETLRAEVKDWVSNKRSSCYMVTALEALDQDLEVYFNSIPD